MNRASQQLTLPDSRQLGFGEFGRIDGIPVIYNHGFPASRLEARLVEQNAAELGLRLIAVDRPGFGLSSPRPGRSLLDWPADIERLADHLELTRFAMLGVSGGGPATLACAARLKDRLTTVTIVCGLGPVAEAELMVQMGWPARFSFGLARRMPMLARLFFGRLVGPLLGRFPHLALRLLTVAAPPADAAVLQRPPIRRKLVASIREAFRQGGRGPTAELCLQVSPWPFEYADLRSGIEFWHGRADATVPHHHTEFLAERLPGAEVHSFPGEGHFSLPINHAPAILARLRHCHLRAIEAGEPPAE